MFEHGSKRFDSLNIKLIVLKKEFSSIRSFFLIVLNK